MRPARETFVRSGETYFASSQTLERRPFFRHERWALLMQEVLQHYRGESYLLHAYVIMPDHFHTMISPKESLERAMQNVEGGFSFRASRAFDWRHDIWQVGFSDHRIRSSEDWDQHIGYIRSNPIKAKLTKDYPFIALDLDPIPQRLKPLMRVKSGGGAEAPPLQSAGQVKAHGLAPAPTLQSPGQTRTAGPANARPLRTPGQAKAVGRAYAQPQERTGSGHARPLRTEQ
jgi:putative transposase